MSNCIVAQSGGPTSVINATVAGVVKGNQMNPIYDHVYGGLNGIEGIRLYNAGNQDGKLSLGGIKPGTPVRVYDTAGRMRLATTAGKEHALIGLESLPHGIYIIRAGDTAIKFTKK